MIYNIFDQAPEDELFPRLPRRASAVIARVPFDEGSLTGTLTPDSRWPEGDWRNTYFVPGEPRPERRAGRARCEKVVPDGMTLPELALRFILPHPAVQHGHPRHAHACARAGQPGRRRRAAARPPGCSHELRAAPLGPHSDGLVRMSRDLAVGASAVPLDGAANG